MPTTVLRLLGPWRAHLGLPLPLYSRQNAVLSILVPPALVLPIFSWCEGLSFSPNTLGGDLRDRRHEKLARLLAYRSYDPLISLTRKEEKKKTK